MIWFLEDKACFDREMRAVAALASEDWLVGHSFRFGQDAGGARLCLDAELRVGEASRKVTATYPLHFPDAPPSVRPTDSQERWSAHQFGPGGELCLEIRPDNWEPTLTAADMLRSVYKLLGTESGVLDDGRAAAVPDAHSATIGQEMRAKFMRLVVTRSFSVFLAGLTADRAIKFASRYVGKNMAYVAAESSDEALDPWINADVPNEIRQQAWQRGYAAAIKQGDPRVDMLPDAVRDGSCALRELVLGKDAPPFASDEVLALALPLGVRAFFLDAKDGNVWECGVMQSRDEQRLPSGRSALKGRKLAIVGCGSLGSKVAAALARSGADSFLLVDDDVLFPENLVRNELDWRAVGAHKAHALSERLKLIAPQPEVSVVVQRVGGQESSQSLGAALAKIAVCDIIVDATGSAMAFNYLSGVARSEVKPMVWAQVFGGGYGGLIARSRPSVDLAPQQARAAIHRFCFNADFPAPPVAVIDYGAANGDGEPMIADDADVAVIAAHCARLALDTLLDPASSAFEESAYMIGLRKEWIFEAAFDTWPISIPATNGAQPAARPFDEKAVDAELMRMVADLSASAGA